jgi:hypothetical protein
MFSIRRIWQTISVIFIAFAFDDERWFILTRSASEGGNSATTGLAPVAP